MEMTNQNNGFTVLCDEKGEIRKLLRDSIGFGTRNPEGKLLHEFLSEHSRTGFIDFLSKVKRKKIAFIYQIEMISDTASQLFVFGGVYTIPDILIVASANRSEFYELINQIQLINNDQANQIRRLTKEKYDYELKKKEEDNLIFNDISRLNNELVNLQRELTRKNVELANLNDLKNRFLGMAAHDLRNPIWIINSYSDFLIGETKDILSEQHKEFLDIIYSSTQFMLALIDDLLDISKIESGKIDLQIEETRLSLLMTKIVKLNAELSRRKNIEINLLDMNPELVVKCDSSKIEQVFNNLLSNAIKFSMPGTKITVIVSENNGSALISVSDQGQGIPETELDQLFRPFQKTSVKSTGGEKSTGLGLSIAKRIVDAHNGSITVESIVGKGTTFYVRLPNTNP